MKKRKWKIEELLEREPSEENCPRVLYRGDWLQRAGCYCSGLVPKYAQRFCRQRGEPSVKGDDLLEQIKPILKRCLQGLSWWDKMKDPISNWDALVLAQHYGLVRAFWIGHRTRAWPSISRHINLRMEDVSPRGKTTAILSFGSVT